MGDSDSEIDMKTPPDIVNAAMNATNKLSPQKSRAKYAGIIPILTMKILLLLVGIFATAKALSVKDVADNKEFLNELLNNSEMMKKINDCLLDIAPCGDMQEFKVELVDIIKSNCDKCPPNLKQNYSSIKQQVRARYPEEYDAIMEKYDVEDE